MHALAYFDPNKYTSMPKYAIFLTFLLVTFLVWTLQCTETLIALTVQSNQQHQKYKVHLSFYTTWDI